MDFGMDSGGSAQRLGWSGVKGTAKGKQHCEKQAWVKVSRQPPQPNTEKPQKICCIVILPVNHQIKQLFI